VDQHDPRRDEDLGNAFAQHCGAGRIALIRKGSKTVIGVADLVDTVPKLSQSALKASVAKHQVPAREIDEEFRHNTAWVLDRAQPLRQPVPYRHPAGAVIWVNLDPDFSAMVERQLIDEVMKVFQGRSG
jgi:hypothetical protein